MPFYEYQCKSCGHELEAMQKVSDSPLRKCPECGKSQLTRLMSAPVFRLKGGGWYETDFKGDKDSQRNLADRPDADAPKDAKADSTGKDEKGKEGQGGAKQRKPRLPRRPLRRNRLQKRNRPINRRKNLQAAVPFKNQKPQTDHRAAAVSRKSRSRSNDAARLG